MQTYIPLLRWWLLNADATMIAVYSWQIVEASEQLQCSCYLYQAELQWKHQWHAIKFKKNHFQQLFELSFRAD